jgi:hypothetical protein
MEVHSESIGVGGHAFRLNVVRVSNSEYRLHVVHDNGTSGGEVVAEERLRPDPLRGLVLDDPDGVARSVAAVAGDGGEGEGEGGASLARIRTALEDALVRAALRFNLLQDTALHDAVHLMKVHGVQVAEVARLIMECARASGGDVSVAAGILRAAAVAPEDVMDGAREGEAEAPRDPCRALHDALAGSAGRAGATVVLEALHRIGALGNELMGERGLPPMTVEHGSALLVVDPFDHAVSFHTSRVHRDGSISYEPVGYTNAINARILAVRRVRGAGGAVGYEVAVVRPNGARETFSGTAPEILRAMSADALIGSQRTAQDALNTIIAEAERRGLVEEVERLTPGVYPEGDGLRVMWPRGSPPEGDLAEALDAVEELARWYRPEVLATVLKWGIASPLSYAVRKLGGVFPELVLYGPRDSGKSALAQMIAGYLWDRDPLNPMRTPDDLGERASAGSGESVATAFRVEELGAATTFPVMINEANPVFLLGRGRVENANVMNFLKAATSSVGGRGRKREGAGYVLREVLAPFVFTLNPSPPVDFRREEWEGKTFIVVYFTRRDRPDTGRIREFNALVVQRLPALAALGRFALEHAAGRGVKWLKEVAAREHVGAWEAIGRELLEEAYRAAGRDPPEWLGLSAAAPLEEVRYEAEEELRELVVERLGEALLRAYMEVLRIPGNTPEEDWAGRIRLIVKHKVVQWLRIIRSDEGEGEGEGGAESVEEAVLLTGVLEALRGRGEAPPIANLRDLADLMGWRYENVHSRTAGVNTKGVRVRLSDLAARLDDELELDGGKNPDNASG